MLKHCRAAIAVISLFTVQAAAGDRPAVLLIAAGVPGGGEHLIASLGEKLVNRLAETGIAAEVVPEGTPADAGTVVELLLTSYSEKKLFLFAGPRSVSATLVVNIFGRDGLTSLGKQRYAVTCPASKLPGETDSLAAMISADVLFIAGPAEK